MEAAPQAHGSMFFQRWLDPIDILSEAIYGVLIVMTFTMAYQATFWRQPLGSAVEVTHVRQLLLAAIGCAVAWGLIDGVIYILTCVFERAEEGRLMSLVRGAPSTQAAIDLIAKALDHRLAPLVGEEERRRLYASIYERLRQTTAAPVRVIGDDISGALATVAVALMSTLPAVIPFLFFTDNPYLALRLSNLIAIMLLFFLGWRWARYVGARPLWTGFSLAALGVLLVAVAIPLGG